MQKRHLKKLYRNAEKKLRFPRNDFRLVARTLSLISVWSLIVLICGNWIQIFPQKKVVYRDFPGRIEVAPFPSVDPSTAPTITAKAFLVVDGQSRAVLGSKNPESRISPASLTKLMTALVALDYYPPETVLTVRRLAPEPGEAEMGLAVGEQISVANLLYGLLVPSGNDASYALADNYYGGIENFVYAMNQRAKSLHMNNTHFVNPNGTDNLNHYSSARDLLLLTREALANDQIKRIVATSGITVFDSSGLKSYRLTNVNQLLGIVPGVEGVKTGFTDLAGQCLITATKRYGHIIYTIVLGSSDRFGESTRLIEWAFKNVVWEKIDYSVSQSGETAGI